MGKDLEIAEKLKAISHPVRIKILGILLNSTEEFNVSQLGTQVNISQSKMSQHLKILKSVGMVEFSSKHLEKFYRLSDNGSKEFMMSVFRFL